MRPPNLLAGLISSGILLASISCTQPESAKKSNPGRGGESKADDLEKVSEDAAYAFRVTWKTVENADTYKVYGYLRGKKTTWILAEVDADSEESTQSALVDDSKHEFDEGDKACFVVKAFTKKGEESVFSKGICNTI